MQSSKIQFYLTAGTHVGCVRKNNEDNFVLNADLTKKDWFLPEDASKPLRLGGYGSLMVVADGMGGTNCGEVASAIAVSKVQQLFDNANLEEVRASDVMIEELLCDTAKLADEAIKQHAKDHPETRGMGTTLVVAWVIDGNVHLVWCGDSRAYIYNKENGLLQISHDHSYVQTLVDKGELTKDEAMSHPQSNIITRCLSDNANNSEPEYRLYTLLDGDVVMLCTDGLSAYCTEAEIAAIMDACDGNVIQTRNQLIQSALDAGGFDNVTVAVMKVEMAEE